MTDHDQVICPNCVHQFVAIPLNVQYAFRQAEARANDVGAENTRLRAALAMSDHPCVYCALPANEWGKCRAGFPGCARSDDATGCPEFGAMMQLAEMRERAEKAETALRAIADGNMGDEPWQVDYARIRDVARNALRAAQEPKP